MREIIPIPPTSWHRLLAGELSSAAGSRSHFNAALPLIFIAASCLLASCAVGPNYQRPDIAVPTAFKSTAAPSMAAGVTTPAPTPVLTNEWWKLFQDPELDQLIADAVAGNFDLKAAMARVDAARAALHGATGALLPDVSLDPSVRRARTNSSTTNEIDPATGAAPTTGSTTTTRPRITTTYSLPLDISYEFDVWGKLRRQLEYYRNTAQASADDFAVVRQTTISDVAQGYFALRLYDTQIDVLTKSLDYYHQLLNLTQTKYKAGLALPTDLLQAQTQVYSAQNQLTDVQRSRVKQEHALAILTGRAPEQFSLPSRPLATLVPTIPAGLPADLLNRRPDVAEAEHKLAAANAQIGVAQANFLPSFSLTGSAGFQSTQFGGLTNWENRVWSIAPSISLPIFQGGKLTAALAQARANYQELVADYHGAVLTALREVEDELSDLQLLAQKADLLDKTLTSAREYSRLTELQYKQGLTTYLQVIDANQTLLTNELTAAQTQGDRLTATVALMKALGGGWTPGGI